MFRIFAYVGLIMKAAVAKMAAMPRLVWEGGKLVAKTIFPGAPAEAAAAEAELAAALSQQAGELGAVQAPAEPPVDPATEWGKIARSYAFSTMGGLDDVDLGALDEAAQAWLTSLPAIDLLRLTKVTSKEVGQHMFGEKLLPGVRRCEKLGEYQRRILEESTPGTPAHARKAAQGNAVTEVLETLRAEGRLPVYAPV